jgi:type IV secretion system protein VirD4
MTSPVVKNGLKAAFAGTALLLLLAAANYLAGVILFMTFLQNPSHANFMTIEHAFSAAERGNDVRAMKKVKLSGFVALLLCLGGPLGLVLMGRKQKEKNLFGEARFADQNDIRQEKLDSPKGLVIGKFKDRLLRLGGYEFVLLAAPTRTGKGVGFCIPNLLQFQDSAVVLDIKGENYNLSSEFRRRYMGNQIYYFNPFSETTHRWNPLSYMSQDPNFRANDLMALAAIIYPTNEKDPFWSDAARNLFVGLGLLVLETPELPQTIGEILRQGSGKGYPIDNYLKHVLAVRAASERPLSGACRDSLGRFLDNAETTMKSVLSSFSAPLAVFGNPVIDKATSFDDFDLRDVRKKKMTVYLHIPAGEILQASFIINLFFSQLVNENVKQLPEQNPELKYQCLLLLDEFTAMGKVAIIAKGVGYMAGYNMRLAIIIQDKTQLEAVYGKEDAHNIVSNMGAVIYFTPSQIQEAEEYSKMIGNIGMKSNSVQRSKGGLFGAAKGESGGSETESTQSRALMLPQELLAMSKNLQLVVRSGIPVIQAGKIRYFEDDYFKERFNAVPMQEVNIAGERRKVPVPVKLPAGDWDVWKAAVASSEYYVHQSVPAAAVAAPTPAAPDNAQQHAAAQAQAPAQAQVRAQEQAQTQAQAHDEPAPARSAWPLPALPENFAPFFRIQSLLADPAANQNGSAPPTRVARAWAESIVRYWQLAQFSNGLNPDNALVILDLNAGDGQFAWQMLCCLRERLATLPFTLPPFHYMACVATARQQQALQSHTCFTHEDEDYHFSVALRDTVLASQNPFGDGNPVVVIAHDAFADMEQQLLAIHYGKLLQGQARVPASGMAEASEVTLEFDWPEIPFETLAPRDNAVMAMYRDGISSAPIVLPSGALACIDSIERLASGRYLLLSCDRAICDEREIRLGAFSAPTVLQLPTKAQESNYHALDFYLRALGARVWQEKVIGSKQTVCVALADSQHPELSGTLPDLVAPLAGTHHDASAQLAKIAEKMPLQQCLVLLQQADHDPALLAKLEPSLRQADWQLPATGREQWQQALARAWALHLPQQQDESPRFYQTLTWLALQVSHYGLARKATQSGLNHFGENTLDLYRLAVCDMETGNNANAIRYLRRALVNDPTSKTCTDLLAKLSTRLQHQQAYSWYRSQLAKQGHLRLEPLAGHHAGQMVYQYRDPQIAAMASLPALTTVTDAEAFIATQGNEPGRSSCAVLHEERGFVGVVSLQRAADSAYLYFWIGADHQGQGHGVAAAKTMLAMAQASGIRCFYTSCFADNLRSRRALANMDFEPIEISALAPHNDLLFYYMGIPQDIDHIQNGLVAFCRAVNSRFEFNEPERRAA